MVTVNETNREPDGTFGALEATDSITDPEGNTVTSLSDPMRVTEEAVTFAESNVTVTHNKTQLAGESIELGPKTSSVTAPDASGSYSISEDHGVIVNPNTSLDGVTVTLYEELSGFTTAYLRQPDDTLITSKDISSLTGGDSFKISHSLSSGTDYVVTIGAGGSSWTTVNESGNFPYTSQYIDVVDGYDPNGDSFGRWRGIGGISASAGEHSSGDVLISFDSGVPADIDSWDLATFQRTLDGETVTIDVEDSTDTVLKSDISKDTDISGIATSTDVQLRANLSRNDTSNNPTVDYLARRFTR